MVASLGDFESPINDARAYLQQEMRYTPTLGKVMLDQYDRMMRGEPTPYLDRFPELKHRVEAIHRHFQHQDKALDLATGTSV